MARPQAAAFLLPGERGRQAIGRRYARLLHAGVVALLNLGLALRRDDARQQRSGSENCSGGCPCNGNGKSNKNQSSNPAKDSTVKGATAPGNVDQKNLANKGGWGSLPAKEQAEAKQHLKDKFPPHYEKIVEEFNKKIAERKRN